MNTNRLRKGAKAVALAIGAAISKHAVATAQEHEQAATDIRKFECNVCGRNVSAPYNLIADREAPSCSHCGSNRRYRTIIYALSISLFKRGLTISAFPDRPDLAGIGLSDSDIYANRLAKKLNYKNTFLHTDPYLDITDTRDTSFQQLDFLISSDVFEHVAPPVAKAFQNVRALLRTGGTFVFSVPYGLAVTQEHFPNLNQFSIKQQDDRYVLTNKTRSGDTEIFHNLVFHGGPGSTLEMRVFGLESLYALFRENGFSKPTLIDRNVPEFGIEYIDEVCSIPMFAYAL